SAARFATVQAFMTALRAAIFGAAAPTRARTGVGLLVRATAVVESDDALADAAVALDTAESQLRSAGYQITVQTSSEGMGALGPPARARRGARPPPPDHPARARDLRRARELDRPRGPDLGHGAQQRGRRARRRRGDHRRPAARDRLVEPWAPGRVGDRAGERGGVAAYVFGGFLPPIIVFSTRSSLVVSEFPSPTKASVTAPPRRTMLPGRSRARWPVATIWPSTSVDLLDIA